jgi:hypothetical protein
LIIHKNGKFLSSFALDGGELKRKKKACDFSSVQKEKRKKKSEKRIHSH